MWIEILIGFVLALGCVWGTARFYSNKDHAFWRVGLVIAALIYVVFALVAGQMNALPIELFGVALYSVFALLSKRFALHWLAIGWLLHIAWDILLHTGPVDTYAPDWYPGMCLGFDLVIAVYIFYLYKKRKKQIPVES